jgi:hypothetical protein
MASLAELTERGVERFYLAFTDFAALPTLARFGAEVIGGFRAAVG